MLNWKRIVAATDFSPTADVAVKTAAWLVRRSDGGEVVAIHVVEPPPPFFTPQLLRVGPPEAQAEWVEGPRREMGARVARLRRGRVSARGVVRVGTPWREIVRLASETGADGICIGNSGHSRVERLLLGATAENVLRSASVPVLVTRDRPLGTVRRVLLPIDLDEGSRRAVRFAVERFPESVRLDAVFVIPSFPTYMPDTWPVTTETEEFVDRARAFLDAEGGDRIGLSVIPFADPAWSLLTRIRREDPDLVLVATHGRRGMARLFFGSVSEKIVRHAGRPVLALPGPGREARHGRLRAAEPLEGEVAPLGRKRPPRPAPEDEGPSRREIRERASLTHKGRGPWTGQAHTGRGGPEGRRGFGHKPGKGRGKGREGGA